MVALCDDRYVLPFVLMVVQQDTTDAGNNRFDYFIIIAKF